MGLEHFCFVTLKTISVASKSICRGCSQRSECQSSVPLVLVSQHIQWTGLFLYKHFKSFLTPRQQFYARLWQKKMFEIHFWVYKALPNSFHLHFLASGSLKWEKTVVASENIDSKLFRNGDSWQILKFLNGTPVYYLILTLLRWAAISRNDSHMPRGIEK